MSLGFILLFKLWMTSNQGLEDEVSAVFFLAIGLIMLVIAEFLATLRKLKIGITANFFRDSFGFIKFEAPLRCAADVYQDEKNSLKYID